MRIGTIGAGFIARAVAAVAIRHGHEVMVSNTRTPDTLFSVTDSIGCKAGTPAEAASLGEIALVAIPLKNYRSIPLSSLEGKIVIDANNYYTRNETVA
jgi:predicted dinucleotide-binding enzyme